MFSFTVKRAKIEHILSNRGQNFSSSAPQMASRSSLISPTDFLSTICTTPSRVVLSASEESFAELSVCTREGFFGLRPQNDKLYFSVENRRLSRNKLRQPPSYFIFEALHHKKAGAEVFFAPVGEYDDNKAAVKLRRGLFCGEHCGARAHADKDTLLTDDSARHFIRLLRLD